MLLFLVFGFCNWPFLGCDFVFALLSASIVHLGHARSCAFHFEGCMLPYCSKSNFCYCISFGYESEVYCFMHISRIWNDVKSCVSQLSWVCVDSFSNSNFCYCPSFGYDLDSHSFYHQNCVFGIDLSPCCVLFAVFLVYASILK